MFIVFDRIRQSTWIRLGQLRGGVLSGVLRHILQSDPLHPLLAEAHYEAMDRRLTRILRVVTDCIEKLGELDVLVVDKYSSQYGDELGHS